MYERVEVVRGATGLTTGAGNPSAAINLVHKRATSKQLTGSAEIGIGAGTSAVRRSTFRPRSTRTVRYAAAWLANTPSATAGSTWARARTNHLRHGRSRPDAENPAGGRLQPPGNRSHRADVGRPAVLVHRRQQDQLGSIQDHLGQLGRLEASYNQAYVNLEHSFDNGWKARAYLARGDRKADSHLLYLSGVPDRVTGLGMYSFAGSYVTHTKQDDVNLQLSGPFELGRKHEAAIGYMHSKKDFTSDSRAADFGTATDVGNFNNWNGAAFPTPPGARPPSTKKARPSRKRCTAWRVSR
jgi:outer membrane receptor for ferric coprogen and ferric-rhodotorulic acid